MCQRPSRHVAYILIQRTTNGYSVGPRRPQLRTHLATRGLLHVLDERRISRRAWSRLQPTALVRATGNAATGSSLCFRHGPPSLCFHGQLRGTGSALEPWTRSVLIILNGVH